MVEEAKFGQKPGWGGRDRTSDGGIKISLII